MIRMRQQYLNRRTYRRLLDDARDRAAGGVFALERNDWSSVPPRRRARASSDRFASSHATAP